MVVVEVSVVGCYHGWWSARVDVGIGKVVVAENFVVVVVVLILLVVVLVVALHVRKFDD